ncbi:hypothetical protein PRZ48_015207 [Zasmidium cellare]|uniref:Antifreeze protein n=1 Tax=Zasmidium cellare TaxID=395010 RepID=A0ABR0DYK4_ZASCE|nr:hypothetical protein PRZ48_015207 [Zasmidium cellare]
MKLLALISLLFASSALATVFQGHCDYCSGCDGFDPGTCEYQSGQKTGHTLCSNDHTCLYGGNDCTYDDANGNDRAICDDLS